MADRKQEPVSLLPIRLFRAELQRVKVGDRENIGDAERLRDIALSLHFTHTECVEPDAARALAQRQ